ncbi:hypothetical protein ZHAS_00006802 [Anopheles sinensis]|uniref:SAM domain-containing protein n=1 Tax=Anopheles sinensis TaxID=74873 RepID=A0A084VN00_ANOSI|nr:hypothetical protein ZHAS_00006802 [Anopheles sinensis]
MRRVRFNLNNDKPERARVPPCPKKVAFPVVPARSFVSGGMQVFTLGSYEDAVRASIPTGACEPRNRDRDVIYNWLRQILFQEYTNRFLSEGYDLLTISRMTSADLVALGIKHPVHRRHLRSHIEALHLPDLLPSHVPASIEKWMHFLRLDEYVPAILAQGYRKVTDVTVLEWEDLEDLGIMKMGHQKKILMGIERIKDEQSDEDAGATTLISAPSIEDMHDPCVLDRVEEMLAILIQELDTIFEDQMNNI